MKVDPRSIHAEERRARRLRRKLGKVLPEEELAQCENLSHLESRKEVVESIESFNKDSRSREKQELIKFIEEAEGIDITRA